MANRKSKNKECPISHEEKYIHFLENMIQYVKNGGTAKESLETLKYKLSKARLKLKILTNK